MGTLLKKSRGYAVSALPFLTVDVFTETRFGRNALAVVTGDDALDGETMQAITPSSI